MNRSPFSHSAFERGGLGSARVFDEEEVDVLVDDRGTFLVCRDERIVDLGHELDDLKVGRFETGFFADFAKGGVFGGFLAFLYVISGGHTHYPLAVLSRKEEDFDLVRAHDKRFLRNSFSKIRFISNTLCGVSG